MTGLFALVLQAKTGAEAYPERGSKLWARKEGRAGPETSPPQKGARDEESVLEPVVSD
jgi:hypothetical protein